MPLYLQYDQQVQSGAQFFSSAFVEVTADKSISPSSWGTLLSTSLTMNYTGHGILVNFSGCLANTMSNKAVFIRLVIDSSVKRSECFVSNGANYAQPVTYVWKESSLSVGLHTITMEWRVDAGSGQCRPVTYPDQECAMLLVEEVGA